MEAPKPGEPLVVRGVAIPWNDEPGHEGWFLKAGRQRIGIERYESSWPQPHVSYRYLRLEGGPWSTCEDINFSIDFMVKELRALTASEKFMDLLLAVSPRHS